MKAIHALFFFSGMTSLIYEVIWVRLLTLTFGAAAFAVASVLLAYMGGLCAGSWWLGRRADAIKNKLLIYAALEIFIGLYALILPWVLNHTGSLYVLIFQHYEPGFYAMSIIRLLCSTLVLGIPTFCMGGTLPLLAAGIQDNASGHASRQVASLYSINTLGAVFGCLLAGYVFIPQLGLNGTTWFASFCNVSIFVLVVGWQKKFGLTPVTPSAKPAKINETVPLPREIRLVVFSCLAISGLCSMAYQTIWTRLISMVIGTTVYAFTVILAAFLLGIVLGSWLYRGWFARNSLLALAWAQLTVGLFVLFSMPYFDELPFLFLKLFAETRENWILYQTARMLFVLAIMIIPTTCFGLSFPLVVGICSHREEGTGRTVGNIYAVNTVGAIIGSFIGGFVLIPFLGLQKSLMILCLINTLAGFVLLSLHPALQLRPRIIHIVTAMLGLFLSVFLLRPWNLHYLNSAPYVYATDYNSTSSVANLKKILNSYELRFFKEDATATVSVFNISGTLSLAIDGKTDASTGGNADMSTQILLAHLPALLAPRTDEALLVGLGSGVSLGSLLKYPVSHVDVLEISQAVVEASDHFQDYNSAPLQDPRVNMIVGDGRHHLLRTKKSYDVIISQPSNPWITGVSNLFTTEYYRLMSGRLSPDGVVCQWIPSYHMTEEMLAVILKSFHGVFPYVTLWTSSVPGDLFAIGSNAPIQVRFPAYLQNLERPAIRQDLARIQMDNPLLLAKTFKYGQEQFGAFVQEFGKNLPDNSDTFPIVEFMTPRFLWKQKAAHNLHRSEQLKGNLSTLLAYIRFEKDTNREHFTEGAMQIMSQ
ncbi:fused MFS/spermidine synthase [Oligoflexus tunisiensis]|uniref:fused MFS/spermidine synthase n=1 Tax=Oligoflexus tunisiensis TaxID=708132 RepID=UPI00114D191A|nr:fused MFS/spermidine synthase [Oligoflexus tunisiensis]